MRILFLANDGEGLYKFRKELIEELLKDNEVFVSLPRDKYIPSLENMGCKYIETSFNRKGTNPISDIKLYKFYKTIINEVKPDVVLTYTIKPSVYGGMACQKLNVPYIVNITGLGSSIENGGLLSFIALSLYKIGIKSARRVFFQNTTNRDFMLAKRAVKPEQCDLVPGSGVNLKDYSVLDYPDDKTIDFVYIGRIMTEKGFGQYAEAAKYIHDKYPNTIFHIAGEFEDDYRDVVQQLSKEGVFVYHGSVENMKDEIYKIVNCVVHPTYYAEGLSNVLLEALACGRPIITTNRAGCKEVVDDNINGFIVKQKDSKDLIEKIEKFISLSNEQRKQLGLNGRKKVEEQFDRNIVIDKYIKEINSIK